MTARCVLVALLLAAVPARGDDRADPELKRQLKAFAADLKSVLLKSGELAVKIEPFRPKPTDKTKASCGAGVQQSLAAALAELKVTVSDTAGNVLTGEYAFGKLVDDWYEFEIEFTVTQRANGRKVPLEKTKLRTRDMRELPQLVGALVYLPPDATATERNERMGDAVRDPKVYLHGPDKTRVSSEKGRPYAVELLAGKKDQLRTRGGVVERGVPFFRIDQDEEYRVKVYNDSPFEVAVQVAVDGIDSFQFSEDVTDKGMPRFSHYIVPAAAGGRPGELEVPGWHRTADPARRDNYWAFLVTQYGRGKASLLNKTDGVGQVTVRFHQCFPAGTAKGRNGGPTETGAGRDLTQPQAVVVRDIDVVCDCVTVRYANPAPAR